MRHADGSQLSHSFSVRNINPKLASQMRAAFSSIAWNTGSSSPGDELMTRQHLRRRCLLLQRLGQIVVRWRNSLSSRVFSMAMTAWAAKFCTSAICLSVKGEPPGGR